MRLAMCNFAIVRHLQRPTDRQVYLVITTDDGNSYLGKLMFERSGIAKVMYDFFLTQINRRVSMIGSINIPVTEKLG